MAGVSSFSISENMAEKIVPSGVTVIFGGADSEVFGVSGTIGSGAVAAGGLYSSRQRRGSGCLGSLRGRRSKSWAVCLLISLKYPFPMRGQAISGAFEQAAAYGGLEPGAGIVSQLLRWGAFTGVNRHNGVWDHFSDKAMRPSG